MALTCDRCTKVVKSFMMSRFNTECICKECIASEKLHPDYQKAVEAELASIKNGDRNFAGIGLPDDLRKQL